MKKRLITSAVAISCFISVLAQPIIITDTVIQTSLCAGSSIIIPFTVIDTGGSFNFGNIFTAQLSNEWTDFSNPTDIGIFFIPWTTSGYILGTIPVNSPLGGVYRVRVVGSDPPVIGSPSPNLVFIVNTAILATINAPQSVICTGDSVTLMATPFFSSHQWALNGTSVPGATSDTLSAYQAGSYTVTVVDAADCESTSEPFELEVEVCVGIGEKGQQHAFEIYPNPITDILTIDYPSAGNESVEVSIKNILGQAIVPERKFDGSVSLNLSDLNAGLYYVELRVGEDIYTKKFVVE